MFLNNEIKTKIIAEYNSFKKEMYGSRRLRRETPEADRKPGEIFREDLDAFFTPPEITIPMIEKMNCDSLAGKTILDPTSGSGNLLAACLIAGADADKIFGNDYDDTMVKICRKRLSALCEQLGKEGFKYFQIHRGNALQKRCLTEFSAVYQSNYNPEYIDDLDYATGNASWDTENADAQKRMDNKKLEKPETDNAWWEES